MILSLDIESMNEYQTLCALEEERERKRKDVQEEDLRWPDLNGLKLFTTFPLTTSTCWVTPQICARMKNTTQILITAATPVHPGARLS